MGILTNPIYFKLKIADFVSGLRQDIGPASAYCNKSETNGHFTFWTDYSHHIASLILSGKSKYTLDIIVVFRKL